MDYKKNRIDNNQIYLKQQINCLNQKMDLIHNTETFNFHENNVSTFAACRVHICEFHIQLIK